MQGRTISHFRVGEKIGTGGMGEVHRAEDLRLGRPVALKFLPPEAVSDPERRQRFLREARTEASLSHPAICTVHEVDEADGAVFIAMELVEGKTLRQRIGGRPLPVADALRIASEMAEALSFAHEARIIHRDLKPENVMVRPDGHVKILDFGLAKLLKEPLQATLTDLSQAPTGSVELTAGMKIMGTAAYMSPEQARGEKADASVDVFAFGVILHEMLTGRNPFRREGYPATLEAIRHAEAPPVSQARARTHEAGGAGAPAGDAAGSEEPGASEPGEILSALDPVVARCLEKDRDRRYDSMAQVRDEIETIRAKLTASQTGERAAAAAGKPRRVPALAVVGTAVAMVVLVAAVAWQPVRDRFFRALPDGKIESIAVLPFENLSDDPNQAFLTDGITDVLTSDLSRIRALTVISWATSRKFRPPRSRSNVEIADELNVQALIDGRVHRQGDRIRVTANLIEAATDRVVWANSYDRDYRDVMGLQRAIATAVAREVKVALSPQEREHLDRPHDMNPEAYEAYLRGRYALSQWGPAGRKDAIRYMRTAVSLDPASALALAGQAEAYFAAYDILVSPEDALPRVRASAQRALELDDSQGHAHMCLGLVRLHADLDWEGAEQELATAVSMEPGNAEALMWHGTLLVFAGRFDEAEARLSRARELNPLSRRIALQAVWPLYFGRRYEQAEERILATLEIWKDFAEAHVLLGWIYQQTGRSLEGLAEIERAVELEKHHDIKAYLGHAHALAGNTEEARRILGELIALSETRHVDAVLIAQIYAGLGEKEEALDWLEVALEQKTTELIWLKVDPRFDGLRDHPRFREIIRRVGFPA